MGKRSKKSAPPGKKKREPLATSFKCVFCSHENGVSVKLDRKINIGNLTCKSCGQSFQSPINNLTAPIDVYAEWIDACDALAHDTAAAAAPAMSSRAPQARAAPRSAREEAPLTEKYADDGDGFIDDDEADAEADYLDDD